MRGIKIVAVGVDRDVTMHERHTENGKTTRAVIGHTHQHIVVEIEGSDTLWRLDVPEGFLQALNNKEPT
jgi:hypothetical protein